MLLKLSPVGIYDTATQAWAGTDLPGLRDFFEAARHYRKVVIDYLYAKDAFSSREWFVADKGAVDWSTLPQFTFEKKWCWDECKTGITGPVSTAYLPTSFCLWE